MAKLNYISSIDVQNIIYTGVQNNAKKKLTWKCEHCDAGTLHIHASSIGYCQRKMQYMLMPHNKKFASTEEAFLRDGHINEQIVREGITGYEGRFNVKLIKAFNDEMVINGVLYVMHKDFVVEIDGIKYVWKQKSVKDASFKTIIRTHEVPYWYVDQLQTYLFHEKIKRGFVIVKERSSTKIQPFPYDFDEKRVKKLFVKGSSIIKHCKAGTMIEKPYKKPERECKFPCPFYDVCWNTGVGEDAHTHAA